MHKVSVSFENESDAREFLEAVNERKGAHLSAQSAEILGMCAACASGAEMVDISSEDAAVKIIVQNPKMLADALRNTRELNDEQ